MYWLYWVVIFICVVKFVFYVEQERKILAVLTFCIAILAALNAAALKKAEIINRVYVDNSDLSN